MTWREELLSSLKDPEKLKEVSERARNRYQPIAPKFDYKMLEAEGREPGEDDE